jgi:LPS-assembly protein
VIGGAAISGLRSPTAPRLVAVAVVLLATTALCVPSAFAQTPLDSISGEPVANPNAQMLLEADELIYDNDAQLIVAVGNIRIDYDGNQLVARKVTYNQRTGRLTAEGNVEIVQPDGTRTYADKIDITDDFKDGFVNSLRVETTDNTRFAAESAERVRGEVTTFNRGVYTACEPCKDNPEKPPLWQVKSKRIIWNAKEKTIKFRNARLEFFGLPLAFLPYLEVPDHTVKRKTGFLMPGFSYNSRLGFGVKVPYYITLSPSYDVTLNGTGYTNQGFLGEAEWRQRFETGQYSLKIAGISQMKPEAFDEFTEDRDNKTRGMIGSKGKFQINPRWEYGWNILAQTDKNFSYTYKIEGFSDYVQKNEIYLTGLSGRNYFDLRGMKFNTQESTSLDQYAQDPLQPWVLPSFDYSWTAPEPVLGGELNYDANAQGILRYGRDHSLILDPVTNLAIGDTTPGLQGSSWRMTSELEWKRTFIAPGGLAVTPVLAARTDSNFIDIDELTRSNALRVMGTAGLDVRWPILFSTTSSTHVLEPVAQIFVRNNERLIGELPNEDAQSFVFDASNLFERDKFSGFDRVEGGIRANLGLRYSGTFENGWGVHALAGQSYHLGGLNSFSATGDLVNVGYESGLETRVSDYVAMVGINDNAGFNIAARGRFDEKTFEIRRGEIEASLSKARGSITGRYTYIQAQPLYGFTGDRHEVAATASLKLNANWSVFGSATYDIVSNTLVKDSIGFAYDDECFTYSLTGTETRSPLEPDKKPTRSIGFFVSLRTLGDFGSTRALGGT